MIAPALFALALVLPGAPPKKLVILGFDGMDHALTRGWLDAMPNLRALAAEGSFLELETSTPPESPVAWSELVTGLRSERHGIYDFVHRDAETLLPHLSTSRVVPPSYVLRIGGYELPLAGGGVELLRRGRTFWELLAEHGVPARVRMVPVSYPAQAGRGVELIAGMGTPDLLGTYGVFHAFTSAKGERERDVAGGRIVPWRYAQGYARAELRGPSPVFRPGAPPMVVPIEVTADADAPVALVRIDRRPSILSEGDWSDWIPVRFRGGALEPDVPGMVRVLLQSVRPELRVYVSALHLDPLAPAQPLDAPSGVAAELAEELGRFHTLGIPEDAKAVVAGVLDEREYREQADAILSERRRILHREVGRLDRGVLFVYFGTLDQISHVFYGPEGMDTIREYYLRADAIAGEARKVLGEDGALMVLSDHGFAAYDRQVHLNDWLKERGYLAVLPGGGIDWSRTRAYALGLNLLYLNLRGRERDGIVTPEEREGLLARISQALESFVDPATGKQVVTRVVRPAPGEHSERTPDLIVGYNAGYRGSDKAAVGDLAGTVLEDNASAWRGDHCMDPRHVPGVFFFSRKLAASRASLADVTPTILALFGVAPPADLAGRSLLTARETEAP